MREMRHISSHVTDDLSEIDEAAGKEGPEVVDVYDDVED